jgi:putative two-component system response regulator
MTTMHLEPIPRPIVPEAGVPSPAVPRPQPAFDPDGSGFPLLVVDDDPAVRKLLALALSDLGYGVEQAAGVSEARDRLRARGYAMVLSDYEMPRASGLDLLAYVSEVHPEIPFIMLTGHAETQLACASIGAGAVDFLVKPFQMQQLERVIEQNRLRHRRERERAAQITNEVLNGTIGALVAAVDAKDPHTACHSHRVTALARRLGEAVGLSQDRMRVLEFSALLHDVGKIAVPESILLKPGPLDESEWACMKLHPIRSAEIVGNVCQLAEVSGIVRHHHERMDGRGYPDGLAGSAIPPLSRLIGIADAYEALTADRSYRPAFTPEEARRVMSENLETQFDAYLGETFIGLSDLP